MKRADKAERIQQQLDELFPDPPIPLDHTDAFTLLVSVVLSAQTTDKKVNEVTPALFEKAPNAAEMAKQDVETVRQLIRQIGLAPQKAKSLVGLGKKLMADHGGEVPADFDALVELPGVGRKTANVVMAQAFGVPSFPVDTHILRLAHRWGLSTGKGPDQVEGDLKKLFERSRWNEAHLQIIYFGREYCPARYHELADCPICSWAASKTKIAEERKSNLELRTRRSKQSRKSG